LVGEHKVLLNGLAIEIAKALLDQVFLPRLSKGYRAKK
jgi:hypothetical protein